ncbi:hypothetical protein [Collinsella ihumii]|uniref:hypothetical protein n=1 Tax=Collinsella ihumii TaxID=1720204 RepID=UPI001E3F5CB2|nr:hypothetical protein [Collinsella ihumii]
MRESDEASEPDAGARDRPGRDQIACRRAARARAATTASVTAGGFWIVVAALFR